MQYEVHLAVGDLEFPTAWYSNSSLILRLECTIIFYDSIVDMRVINDWYFWKCPNF